MRHLPGSLSWGVLFRTRMLTSFISSAQLGPMLGMPAGMDLARSESVALTSAGKCIAFEPEGPWIWLAGDPPVKQPLTECYADRWSLLPSTSHADCLGFGQLPGLPPVVMALTVENGAATAAAVFEDRPSEDNYDLLAAVGVRFLGGEWRGRHWCAYFSNRLGGHLHAGTLANFARTAHCNLFFLNHGRIDERLEAGLLQAAASRVEHGLGTAITSAIHFILSARKSELAMTCIPPSPQPTYAFGDLVPLGLLAFALRSITQPAEAVNAAIALSERYLERYRVDGLWPFHHGRLPTATDSALILLGTTDSSAVHALERFSDGASGYLPQLSNADGDALHMREDPSNLHWLQTDFATTCLVRALRYSCRLTPQTSMAWLEAWFEDRAALFFANPYLVDWALALAIAEDSEASGMRLRLIAEILSSANEDGSFGRFDMSLSTAVAIAALTAIGYRGRAIGRAQLRLLEMLEPQGRGPATMPFYASYRLPEESAAIRSHGRISPAGEWHALFLYEDTHRMVLGAFAVMALQAPCDFHERTPAPNAKPHPRYLASSATHYIEAFALPPYLRSRA